ncbi:MFS transporter [Paenibacillus cremeus]|uniref:MFS transporter n=1 Tax=Paenibacillus cremeus TaxID=2163881 RepID=UPI0021BD734F|nr:MFS transporter [Paenibacillus cremeus]
MTTALKPKLWNRDFVAVCFSSFFLFMTFYILAVTLPVYVTDQLHGSQQQVGLMMTAFIVTTVILRPLTGKWLDERSPKRILLLALILFTVCAAAYMVVHSYSALLLLRLIHGISFGMAATATGAIAVGLIPEQRSGEGVGYFSLFMSLAMVVGPFLGLTIIEHQSHTVLFSVCICLGLLSLISGSFVRIPVKAAKAKTAQSAEAGWKKLIEPKALPISIAACFLSFSYGAITTFLSVYANSIGLGSYSSYFFMVFAAMIVLSRPFTGSWFDRYGPNLLVYPGVLLFTLGMLTLSLAGSPVVFLLSGAVLGLGFGALLPSFQTIAIQASPAHRRGLATGTYFLLFDSGYGIGSYVLGVVAAHSNYHRMYFVAGLVVACSAVLYYGLHHRKQQANKRGAELAA